MLRPGDIAVLLRLAKADPYAPISELAAGVALTAAQVYQALKRAEAGFLVQLGSQRGRAPQKKVLNRRPLLSLLQHAVRHVYPARLGGETVGVASFSAFAPTVFEPGLQPVWPYGNGGDRGLEIEPLYRQAPRAALADPEFHRALAAVDALRVGRARERQWGLRELEKWLAP
jgi:hypothetical protein